MEKKRLVRTDCICNIRAWHPARKRRRSVPICHIGNQFQSKLFCVEDPVQDRIILGLLHFFFDLDASFENLRQHARQNALSSRLFHEHDFVRTDVQLVFQSAQLTRWEGVIITGSEFFAGGAGSCGYFPKAC